MKKVKDKLKYNINGITLIALVITIIVLLILAGVSITMLTGDNGILNGVNNAKIETALSAVKEQVRLYQIEKKMDNQELTPENLVSEGKVSRIVRLGKEDKYYMYYSLKDNSFDGMQGLGKGNISNLKDVFLIDDNLNIKYIASNGREYGDNLNNKVLEDETEIKFSSKTFSEYISKISGVIEYELKFKWMKNQTSLTITDSTVDSLADLIFFPNLTTLTLGDSSGNSPQIRNLDGIENCTKLTNIMIWHGDNKIYSALRYLANLKSFSRYGGSDYNNIIDALKYCNNLESLSIQSNKIDRMNRINELGNLKRLNLEQNQINKIEGLENKSNIEHLYLSNNQISKVEGLENLKNLETLYLSNNQITDITPLSINTSLTNLYLKGNSKIDGNRNNYTGKKLEALNKIGEILDRNGTINIDVDKIGLFNNYKTLDLSKQQLTTLEPLEGLTQLTELNLDTNQLTLEDTKSQEILKNMTSLRSLNLSTNKITNVTAINNLNNLKILNLNGAENNINLQEIEDIISNLDKLILSTESLKTILNCDINKITKLKLNYLGYTGLQEIPDLSKFTKLVELDLTNNFNVTNFNTISNLTNLKILTLSSTNLHGKMIDFSKLTNLTTLNLSHNMLWSEDLENLKVLKNNTNLTINLSNNSIIDATALLELNANTKINLSYNVNLSQDSKDKLQLKFGNNVTF